MDSQNSPPQGGPQATFAGAPVPLDPAQSEGYLRDESGFSGHAEAAFRVHTGADVAQLFAQASARSIPITFSARRTSLTGAAVPEGGWVLLLPEASDPSLVRVDVRAREATAPAHVLMSDIEAAAEAVGLFFAPDPTSRKSCSIGGSVACNASGARSFAFGAVGRWVVGLTVVLADGQRVQLRRGEHPPQADGSLRLDLPDGRALRVPAPPVHNTQVKNAMGYTLAYKRPAAFALGLDLPEPAPDLLDLFVGSEGTLGFIESVTVALLDKKPVFSALCFFADEDQALRFVELLQGLGPTGAPPAGLAPMSVEWFDQRSLHFAAERFPRLAVPEGAQVGLFVEQRHGRGEEDDVAVAWYEALLDAGVPDEAAWLRVARSHADVEALRDFRHAVPEAVNAVARGRGLRKLGTDLAWPKGQLMRMMAIYRRAVRDLPSFLSVEERAAFEARWGQPVPQRLDYAIYGHVGDNHLHLNFLPEDAAQAEAGRLLYDALCRLCAADGGALSAEHGIGKSKRALLAELISPAQLAQMRAVKRAFDPLGILAPGNVFAAL